MTSDLHVGDERYPIPGSDSEIALAHAVGCAFIELQQLEFAIISYLDILANGTIDKEGSFDIFASKTFGNLLREMRKQEVLVTLADELQITKERRDFFTHKFLFHRYGGPAFTTPPEYEVLVQDAVDLSSEFARARKTFDDLMLKAAPLVMFAGRLDASTGEIVIVESDHAKARRPT